ncbi:hypothetical protein QR680_014465 [Steinernema hermaphroditum]|uniref:Secreted protein n=1 Tax=Steinernema hermaphroditum TaxID=289476 RepID=A0AA39M489_9BILA|nr:hypothetical protein QR680_014465 [Steinernema hermaphroditum]
MDSKVVFLVLLIIGTCFGLSPRSPQFPRRREVPHNCLARGPYGGQYKCYVIIDYYSERFECYSLNVPYNYFAGFGNGEFVYDPSMPGQPAHPIAVEPPLPPQMMPAEQNSAVNQ